MNTWSTDQTNLQEKLRIKLVDIKCLNSKTAVLPDNKMRFVSASQNPLRPHLLLYCFRNILGHKIETRSCEKVFYHFGFEYKGYYGFAECLKSSYKIWLPENLIGDFISCMNEVKPVLSEYFDLLSEDAVSRNQFTMINNFYAYKNKLTFYIKRINEIEKKALSRKELQIDDLEKNCGEAVANEFYRVNRLSNEDFREQQYAIESYIDTWFAFCEHILTLLIPFLGKFERDKRFKMQEFWDKKYEKE